MILARMVLVGSLAAVAALPVSAQRPRAALPAVIDSIANNALKDGRAAGMSVAVVRGRDTIALKGYGYVDLEWKVPTDPTAIYEIGSVTKQFTATSILQLQEQGKLKLDDELTKYLPNYPMQGNHVTIRRLLDHTSGIKGYTEMPEFGAMMMRKMPRDSLVALFSARPFDFAPGEAQVYNNSAFFLLGMIIEKVSGQNYGDYVKQHVFEPAGMTRSRYCSESALVEKRAHGYDATPAGLQRAAYLDHTWPFAAGSLCSTVGDLIAWNRAIHGGKLLTPASYRELITPGALNDGTPLRYAKGIAVDSAFGRRIYSHGGGINGFLSQLDYFPAESLSVVVLVNTAGPVAPDGVVRGIEQAIFGEWSPKVVAFTGAPADYAGEYHGVGRGRELVVKIAPAADGKGLTSQVGPGPLVPLRYLGNELFLSGRTRVTFVREGGKVVKARYDSGAGYSILDRR